jgi:integrating conjugative element protein (TIGR03765 family)
MNRSLKSLPWVPSFLIKTGFALTVIADTGVTTSIEPYLRGIQSPDEIAVDAAIQSQLPVLQALKPVDLSSVLYPVKSDFSEGEVTTHKLNHPLPISFFVIGDDAVSLQWVKDHEEVLKSDHAIGILTNVDSADRLKTLKTTLSMPLIPANLDGLEALVHTGKRYPFWVKGKEVVQ